jgi:hypothetical protein
LVSASFFFFSALFESEAPLAAEAAFYHQLTSPYVTNQFRLFLLKFGFLLSLLRLLLYYPKSTPNTQTLITFFLSLDFSNWGADTAILALFLG